MMHVATNGEFGSLHSHEVFVLAFATFKRKPFISLIALVLISLAEIPTKNKVLGDVVYAGSDDTHCYIVPWHASILCFTELV